MDNLHKERLESDSSAMSSALSEMAENTSRLMDYIRWTIQGRTGISSLTIASAMFGFQYKENDVPYDAGDFKRCVMLVRTMGWKVEDLSRVSMVYPKWKNIIDNWDELTGLYDQMEDEKVDKKMELHKRLFHLRGDKPVYEVFYFSHAYEAAEYGCYSTRDEAVKDLNIAVDKVGAKKIHHAELRRSTYTEEELRQKKMFNILKFNKLGDTDEHNRPKPDIRKKRKSTTKKRREVAPRSHSL